MPVNAQRDYRMAEDKRTIVYRDEAAGVSVQVKYASRYDVSERDVAGSQGQFGFGDVIWDLPADLLEEEPSESGVIDDVAAGESWKPLDVERNELCNIWRCTCRRVRENVA